MPKYRVLLHGYDTHHEKTHIADTTPDQSTEHYTVLCFATPFMSLTREGMRRGVPGNCQILTPDFRMYHSATGEMEEGFVNDWMHVQSEGMKAFLQRNEIPVNVILDTRDPLLLRDALMGIREEFLLRRPLYEEMMSVHCERGLFEIARSLRERSTDQSAYRLPLRQLRQDLACEYQRPWTIRQMADRIGVSVSRFAALYKEQFGVSPMDDLIRIRIRSARILLKGTDMGIRQIAQQCGFHDEYYFSNQFKQRLGVSPRAYRKA